MRDSVGRQRRGKSERGADVRIQAAAVVAIDELPMRILINDPARRDAGRNQDEIVRVALEDLRRVGKREAEMDVIIDDGVGIDRVVTSVDKDLGLQARDAR